MYDKQPNYLRVMKTEVSYVRQFDGYRIKYEWLKKFLLKIGFIIERFAEVEVITYTNLDAKDLHIAIMVALGDSSFRSGRDSKIIMGSEEFVELTKNPEVRHAIQFKTGPFSDGIRADYYNIPVYVYPHIKGWAVI